MLHHIEIKSWCLISNCSRLNCFVMYNSYINYINQLIVLPNKQDTCIMRQYNTCRKVKHTLIYIRCYPLFLFPTLYMTYSTLNLSLLSFSFLFPVPTFYITYNTVNHLSFFFSFLFLFPTFYITYNAVTLHFLSFLFYSLFLHFI